MKRLKILIVICALLPFIVGLSGCLSFLKKNDDELTAVFDGYKKIEDFNFAVNLEITDGGDTYNEYYEYGGGNILYRYTEDNHEYTDYLNRSSGGYTYYSDGGSGNYVEYKENSDEFNNLTSYMNVLYLEEISHFSFTGSNGTYNAKNARSAGDAVLGSYEDYNWTEFVIDIAEGKISRLVGVMDDGYKLNFVFSKYGEVNFTLPVITEDKPADTMESQTYDPATFDKENLQDKMLKSDGAIGLPSTGNVNALVVPVQFKGDTITKAQLDRLEIAFNGTSAQTGWESVKTYYQKASLGKLNLSFDIQDVYRAQNSAKVYETYKENYVQDGETFTRKGDEVILTEVLSYYESRLDLSKYDSNGDGAIDAVYLIYSASVTYDADFYWAYVSWYYGDTQYDNLDAYYYLFAGFDFMDEGTAADKSGNPVLIPGMKVNASTYIHETGHLLGLDDYYDYEPEKGCNEGLGGADMMDHTVGDQNVYSKIMLGWLTPEIVNSTKTVTLSSSRSAILIPLNFDNSYFSEYLLIDLYSAQGLNKLHSSMPDTVLYDGAEYGVRIYHVSSSIKDPYNNDYGSFTDNNNSSTKRALIRLIEADGERQFKSSGGFAAESDLWQAGAKLSDKFPTFTRYDNKKINFDILIDSVSAASASITITFK